MRFHLLALPVLLSALSPAAEPTVPASASAARVTVPTTTETPNIIVIYADDQWKGKSGLGAYADLVMETDAVVGRVLAALDKSGATANTLVVFTSDNGCAPYIGVPDMEKMGHFPSGPLRGYKSDAWEGGHRVPFIVGWPGKVKAATRCDQLVHQADLMATFAAILGTKLPVDVGEDSILLRVTSSPGWPRGLSSTPSSSAGGSPWDRS